MKINKAEILLTLASTVFALLLGLFIIRWLQPSLLGISSDMILVKSDEKVVPFYENIFRKEDFLSKKFILSDPVIKGRAKQLYPDAYFMGPNDLLGFRNEAVPNKADIVIIGDSQTYGNNAHISEDWPRSFLNSLSGRHSVYSMATGGWGAVQYYYATLISTYFKPKIIIVAFYTGNDPLETFSLVYGIDIWDSFISDSTLNKNDAPSIVFPAPVDEQWPVTFSDGVKTIFTPKLRHTSNKQTKVIDASYQSMVNVAKRIAEAANNNNAKIFFTIIPTKEYVYHEKLKQENIKLDSVYKSLVLDEGSRIKDFSTALQSIKNAKYVDVISNMQNAALGDEPLYPNNSNGHPIAYGYKVIGETIAEEVDEFLKVYISDGLTLVKTENDYNLLAYIEKGQYWYVDNSREFVASGKEVNVKQVIKIRDLANYNYSGRMSINDILEM